MPLHKFSQLGSYSLLAIPCLFLCNCTSQHAQVLDPSTSTLSVEPAFVSVASAILIELSIEKNDDQQAPQATHMGPQLIAGDWLAWQCALAGSYWDLTSINAPTYAEAFESELSE